MPVLTDVKWKMLCFASMRSPREIFVQRLNELLPKGEAQLYAKRARISEQTISRWRNGERVNPGLDTLTRLAAALGVPVAYLISDEPAPAVDPQLAERLARDAEQVESATRTLLEAVRSATKS